MVRHFKLGEKNILDVIELQNVPWQQKMSLNHYNCDIQTPNLLRVPETIPGTIPPLPKIYST